MAALATAWEHDILLIDEGIGAGDQAFQEKFRQRLAGFMERAGLLILASHSFDFMRTYCNKGLVLAHGEVQMVGDLVASRTIEQPLGEGNQIAFVGATHLRRIPVGQW